MKDDPSALIDTNILFYAYDNSDAKKHRIASKLLSNCWSGNIKFAVSVQNLAEFFAAINKKLGKDKTKIAKQIIQDIANGDCWSILKYGCEEILKATELCKKKNRFWDNLISATAINNNIHRIYTENAQDFKHIKEMEVVNPFK